MTGSIWEARWATDSCVLWGGVCFSRDSSRFDTAPGMSRVAHTRVSSLSCAHIHVDNLTNLCKLWHNRRAGNMP
jgi:hypothetical protein